jgi:5'-nucleotidase / UDP-sugar diphosphatase
MRCPRRTGLVGWSDSRTRLPSQPAVGRVHGRAVHQQVLPRAGISSTAQVTGTTEGQPITSRVEALDDPRDDTPYLLPPPGMVDRGSVATRAENGAVREIKEWQAIMDHLRRLPVKSPGELSTIPVDERAAEVRAIRAS